MKLLLASVLLVTGLASAQAQETPNIISVSGTGIVKMEVNAAAINGAVVTEAKTVTEAQSTNAKIFNESRQTILKQFSLSEKDFVSVSYNVSPVYKYPRDSEPVLVGYSVRHSFEVKVNKLDQLGLVVDALGTLGTNMVDSVTFSNNDQKKFELEALANAMKDAAEKADVIARATGREVTKVVRVSYHPASIPNATVARAAMPEKASDTSFAPGDLTVVATVTADYQF